MSDEQTMYIEPEDDVTTVRERLRQAPGKQLTLVIPPQSQLRSHLTWRLLNARARELGKDILIVSADPQIRSLAHAVKFRVAHSLESFSQAGKSRPPSRPGRSVTGKSRIPGRPTSARDVPDARGSRAIQSISGTSERGISQFRPTPPPLPEQSWPLGPVPVSNPLQTPQIEDLGPDDAIAGGPPLFGPIERANKSYDQSYDFRSPTVPPIYPVHNEPIEEPDPLLEDYQQAQVIRQAASEGHSQKGPGQSAPEARRLIEQISQLVEPASVPEPTTSHPHIVDDPFVHMEDSQPPPPAEQRAGVVIEDFDIDEPLIDEGQKVEEAPTTIIDGTIEFRGDQDDFVPPLNLKPITTYAELATDDRAKEQIPPRARGGRQSKRRSGNITPPSTHQDDDDALPMPDEPPTAIIPPALPRRSVPLPPQTPAARTSGKLTGQHSSGRPSRELAEPRPSARPSRELAEPRPPARPSRELAEPRPPARPSRELARQRPPARPGQEQSVSSRGAQRPAGQPGLTRPASRSGRTGAGVLSGGTRPGQFRPSGGTSRQAGTRWDSKRRSYLWLVLAIILIIVVAVTAYYGPSANVTLTVTAQSYTHTITLKVSVPQAGKALAANTLPTQSFSKTFTKSGLGKATGSQSVGTNTAAGIVTFTNKGAQDVIIPSGITLTTAGNPSIAFVTTAEALVQANDSLPITVQASQPGDSGNVDIGAITVIPADSLQKIAQRQMPTVAVNTLKLAISNPDETTGGGARPEKAVVDADLTNVQNDLSNQLKASIDAWVKGLSHDGYLSTPQLNTKLINTPAHNTVEESGSFPATVQITATVLLVRNSDLQTEAIRQLNTSLENEKDAKLNILRILTSGRTPVKMEQFKQSGGDATSFGLSFKATGLAGPDLPTARLQDMVAGKSATDARAALIDALKKQGVSNADVQITPGFIPWVTPVADHITLIIQASQT